MKTPAVSIIIPCRNERNHIKDCLRSVLSFEEPEGGFEVLVCDGRSDDGTRDIVKEVAEKDRRLKLIDNPQKNTPCALNRGIEAANGEIIIRVDAHTRYASDYITKCVEKLEETGADNVGGPWKARGRGYIGRAIAEIFSSPFAVGGIKGRDENYEGPVDTVYLGCWRKNIFQKTGGFDETLIRNQDDEFNLRLTLAGFKIWQSPEIQSEYTPRDSIRYLLKQYFQYGYWKVKVIKKHKRPASIRHLVPGVFVISLLVTLFIAAFSSFSLYLFFILSALYISFILLASLHASIKSHWKYLPVFPLLFPCFHFGYGVGFLMGIVDFVVLKRKYGRFMKLTRNQKS